MYSVIWSTKLSAVFSLPSNGIIAKNPIAAKTTPTKIQPKILLGNIFIPYLWCQQIANAITKAIKFSTKGPLEPFKKHVAIDIPYPNSNKNKLDLSLNTILLAMKKEYRYAAK